MSTCPVSSHATTLLLSPEALGTSVQLACFEASSLGILERQLYVDHPDLIFQLLLLIYTNSGNSFPRTCMNRVGFDTVALSFASCT
jgi:hypothetical protein